MEINIREFDEQLFKNNNFLIITENDKKFLIKSIIKEIDISGHVMVTHGVNDLYNENYNNPYKMYNVNHEYIQDIIDTIDKKSYLVLDYPMYDMKNFDKQLLKNELISPLLLTMKYLLDVDDKLLHQFDYIIIENINDMRIMAIYEKVSKYFQSFEVFCGIMNSLGIDYTSLIIDLKASSDQINNGTAFFWYRPKSV
jgi:hypothetical protein